MIKKIIKSIVLGASLLMGVNANSQGFVSDFEGLALDSNNYWNGSDLSGGFTHGLAHFENSYDTTYYSWTGFAYSNQVDQTTAGWGNQYSSFAGEGYNGSEIFSIVNVNSYNPQKISFSPAQTVQGFYITNTTYAALSMRDGDAFAKAFGADTLPNGADTNHLGQAITGEDWFKVSVYGVNDDTVNYNIVVDYYLADYRFVDNIQDYIIDDWNWVNLLPLGDVEGLHFELSSSDVGMWGMNTPAYFAMDDLTVGIGTSKEERLSSLISIYPNPANDRINIKVPSNDFTVSITDNLGREVKFLSKRSIDISDLEAGMYIISIDVEGVRVIEKLIKK